MLKRTSERKWERSGLQWPDELKPDSQLFRPRTPIRKLLVMMDTEVEKNPDSNMSLLEQLDERLLVGELVKHDYIVLYRYADDGPPAGTAGYTVRSDSQLVYPGWVTTEDVDTPLGVEVGVRYSQSPTQVGRGSRPHNRLTIAEGDDATGAYPEMNSKEAKARRRADARAYLAAEAIGVDLLVTHREYLLKSRQYSNHGVLVCDPVDALAFIGLYLRTQGEFRILSDLQFNRGLFYRAGTDQLLSSGSRWRRAIGQYTEGSGEQDLQRISGALFQRVDRALQERDRLHACLNQEQNNDVRDEALFLLDTILLWLMSAFDVAARVANKVLGLNVNESAVGWQRLNGWMKKVAEACPQLAAIMASGTSGQNVLTIVRLLRNSVHGAALQGAAYHNNHGPQQTIVGLPPNDEANILTAMDAEGGRDAWGVVLEIPDYQVQLDPGVFVETAFQAVTPLLNQLMDATPMEKLPHVDLSTPEPVVRGGPYGNPFSPEIGKSIRWQLGL